jgi:hypothetical protein
MSFEFFEFERIGFCRTLPKQMGIRRMTGPEKIMKEE